MTAVYMFTGQGSHTPGMGRDLFDRYPHLVRQADEVLGYSIERLCCGEDSGSLNDTRYTQCAMYVVRVRETGEIPDVVIGHSLGEYAALFAAGAFDFVTGLELVARRAELMAAAGPGRMAAVIGWTAADVRAGLERHGAAGVDIANLNAPKQTVISGPVDAVDEVAARLEDEGASTATLRVSGAFHSRYMAGIAEEFSRFLARYRFGMLKIPVIANVTAAPYEDGRIVETLTRQLREPVRWQETVEYLLRDGATSFTEIGPGQVLTGLVRKIRRAIEQETAAHGG